jgi:hypothetical protein
MSILKTSALIILSSFLLIHFSNCTSKYGVEIAAIDSLAIKNKKTMDNLNIDLVTINTRKIEMKKDLDILQNVTPDSSALEFKMNVDKYKGIHKVYTKFIENYDVIFNRVKLNEVQLASLKNSVLDEKISGQDFKMALDKEKQNVNDNLINSQTIGHRIFQLEPEYQRLSTYFEKQLIELKKNFPELDSLK